jgi:competence protein ComEA
MQFILKSLLIAALLQANPLQAASVAQPSKAPVSAAAVAPVDLNTADVATLAAGLRGIGESKARAIVEYRRINGPFKTIDDLALVKGIGSRTIELNRARLRVAGKAPAVKPAAPAQTAVASKPAVGTKAPAAQKTPR